VDEGDVIEVQGLQQVGDDLDLTTQGQVGTGPHRAPVPAERQHGADVGEPDGQHRQDEVPLRVVHEQAMEQHHGRAATADVVLDRAGGQFDGLHEPGPPLKRSL